MSDCRLYCLDGQGHFTKAHDIGAETDPEALDRARKMKLPVKSELWKRGRKLATLDAHRD